MVVLIIPFYLLKLRDPRLTAALLYVENKEALIPAVSRSSSRKLALEKLVREGILKDKLLRLRVQYERSVEMGRDLLERAFVKFRKEKIYKSRRIQTMKKSSEFEKNL